MARFYLTILILTVVGVTYGQQLYPRVGLTGAFNSYQLPGYDMKPRLDFTIGAGYNISLTKSIAIQSEINYVRKSFDTEYTQDILIPSGNEFFEFHESGRERFRFSYLELPVLLKVKIFHKDFFLTGGPWVALGLGGRYKFKYDRTSTYLDPEHREGSGKIRFGQGTTENTNDIQCDNRWDAGFQIGIGALFFKRLQIECRQSLGSTNIFENVKSKHRYLQLSLSTPLALKHQN